MKSWGKRLVGVFFGGEGTGARKMSRPVRTRRVGVEALEERQLLSAGGTVELAAAAGEYDFGDAPDSYGTTLAAEGAYHAATGPTLGATRDAETDGLPTADASGDDNEGNADEDGVTFATTTFVAAVTVNVQNAADGAKLDAWIDFDGDGSFDAEGEQIAASLDVVDGDNLITYVIPEGTVSGETYARFRLSTSGNLEPTGSAVDGEVEDYAVTIIPEDTDYYHDQHSEDLAPEHGVVCEDGVRAAIDGEYCVVGTADGVYIYHWNGDEWSEMQELLPPRENILDFGYSPCISGTRAVVRSEYSIFIYELRQGEWQFVDEWTLPDSDSGLWLMISDVAIDGDTIAVSSYDIDYSGSVAQQAADVYIIEEVAGSWETVDALGCGEAHDLSFKDGTLGIAKHSYYYQREGTTLVSLSSGYVSLYRKVGDEWEHRTFSAVRTESPDITGRDTDDGLGEDVVAAGDLAFGFADEYIKSWVWNESLQTWSAESILDPTNISAIAIDGDVVAYGWVDGLGITVEDASGEMVIPVTSTVRSVSLDDGMLLYRPSSSLGVYWCDVDPEPIVEDYLVAAEANTDIVVSTAGEYAPTVEIYDSTGQLVATSSNGYATWLATTTGVYTVRVTSEATTFTSYDLSILSVLPDSIELGVVDDTEILDALETSPTGQFTLEAARDGYLTVLGHETTADDEASLVLMTADGTVLAQASAASADSSTLWQHEWRLDYEVTGGETYLLAVTGEFDLRLCNLVAQSGTTVNVFDTTGTDAYLFAITDTFDVTANGVEYTFDDATEFNFTSTAGDDTVELVDSDGDDTLTVSPTEMAMTGTTSGGVTYSVSAEGFRYSHAYARVGGNDTAYFVGSEQTERMKAYEGLVKLMGGQYYARAKFFESVEVAIGEGDDTAVVVASDGADVLWAMKEALKVSHNVSLAEGEGPDFDGMAYDVTVTGCESIVARGSGSDDWVQLHDSAVNDVFIAKPHKLQMLNAPRTEDDLARGEEYTITVRGYTNVSAVADQGGDNDVAKLYDSSESGTDTWSADYVDGQTWSAMTSPSRLLYEVLAFEQVGGYGFNGGLGEDHGTNQRDHGDDVDFVFEYGYWEDASTTSRPVEGSWWNGRESL